MSQGPDDFGGEDYPYPRAPMPKHLPPVKVWLFKCASCGMVWSLGHGLSMGSGYAAPVRPCPNCKRSTKGGL